MEKEVKLTKSVDFRKIINEFNPNTRLIEGFDKYILSVAIKEDKIEVFCSLWRILNDWMVNKNLSYEDSLKILVEMIGKENSKRSDITYYFYDDLPNPQLN
jgi:hypothetical protein